MRLLPALLAALLLAPIALAHVQHERPSIQLSNPPRQVHVDVAQKRAQVDLLLDGDPMRHFVRHVVDAPRGRLGVEYREDMSRESEAWGATWEITRLVEYRDANTNGRFEPHVDTVVRSWRMEAYEWNVSEVLNVSVAGQRAKDVQWTGNLSTGPRLQLDMAAVGRDVVDEGARARAQDLLLYLVVDGFPERGTGNLHAIEGVVRAPPGSVAAVDVAQNRTVGFHVDSGDARRRAFLDWGGQGELDRVEQEVVGTLGEPGRGQDGGLEQPFFLHFPIVQSSARLVMVDAIEHETPLERAPAPGAPLVALAAAAVAGALRARRTRQS